jgi:3-oxoacyl-[acyl-carrier protein] reductase
VSADLKTALVLGGSGAVGTEVVRALRRADLAVTFTWHTAEARATALAEETGARAIRLDLRRRDEVREALGALGPAPRVVVSCAAATEIVGLADLDDRRWADALELHVGAPMLAAQILAPRMAGGGHLVFVGALDRAQSLPLPVHFAAGQGALAALTMALAKELGPARILVNMVALGLLDRGLSTQLGLGLVEDFRAFSALRRQGTPEEAARAIAWLALENTYMSGKVVAINGGV